VVLYFASKNGKQVGKKKRWLTRHNKNQ